MANQTIKAATNSINKKLAKFEELISQAYEEKEMMELDETIDLL